jgi:transcriptional regulator with XRE-family HTH domain
MSDQTDASGQRLARARKRKGWTQEQLGVAMGFQGADGQVRVSRWESGAVRLRHEDLATAAAALAVPLYSLLPESEVSHLLEWLEETVRHQDGLSESGQSRLDEALTLLAERVGPPPPDDDDAAWREYLDRLRRLIVQEHRRAT